MSADGPASSSAAALQHDAIGVGASARSSNHTLHPEAQWFPHAGLGLFIHWGIASVHGQTDLSWAMMANTPWDQAEHDRNKIAPDEYWRLAERFQPSRYDPDRWLSAAAAAGFQYAVFTTMHHDGYTLWPSKFGELGVQSHLNGRDLVGPFIEAARRQGLKVGLYYSPPDWYFDRHLRSFNYGSDNAVRFPDRPFFDSRHRVVPSPPVLTDAHRRRQRQTLHHRVEELLTRYGRIDLMWFDGGGRDEDLGRLVRRLQPHIVTNSRTFDGDFAATECALPTERFEGWFETCHCWQGQPPESKSTANAWGYLDHEYYKSTAWMLDSLAQLRAWGGNLLVNVSPRPSGELPDVVYQRFQEAANWMRHSGQSMIGTSAGPRAIQCSVPLTQRAQSLYAHLLSEAPGEITLARIDRPQSVSLLRTGEVLPSEYEHGRLKITVAAHQRTTLVDVVEISWLAVPAFEGS